MLKGQNISQAKAMNVRVKHVGSTDTKNRTKSCKTAITWSCVMPVRPKSKWKTTVCKLTIERIVSETALLPTTAKIEVLQWLNISPRVKVISEDIPGSLPSLGNTRDGGCYNPHSSLPMNLIDLKDLQTVHLPCILHCTYNTLPLNNTQHSTHGAAKLLCSKART